jgi:hypothetical protein
MWASVALGLMVVSCAAGKAAGQVAGGGRQGSQASQASQNATGQTPQQATPTLGGIGADDAMQDRTAKMAADQEKLRNSDRQKKLVADTQHLLELANELKADVDKSNKDMLSLDVIKKADEIEKLAHSVKEKMRGP